MSKIIKPVRPASNRHGARLPALAGQASARRQSPGSVSSAARQAKSLAALNAVAATVSQSLDLETTLNVALDRCLEVIGVEAGGISLIDEQAGELVMRVHRGWRRPDLATSIRLKLGAGMSGQVITSGQVLVTGDVRDDPRLAVPDFGLEGVQAMALAPMRAHGKVVGILSAMSHQPHTFSPDDVKLLAAIADQAGVAIDNARLYENARRQLDELTTLHEVSLTAMYAAYDLDEAIKRIVTVLQRRLGFEYVGLFLVNEADRSAELYATSTRPDESGRNVRIALGQGMVGHVVATGQPLRVGDVEREPRHLPGIPGVRSEMTVPLTVGGQVIGAIDVQSLRQHAFTPDDERILSTVAGQLAVVIENVRLYAETRRRLDELTILSEVALAGASTLDQAQVLDRMLQVICRTLKFESFEVILLDPASGMLRTEAAYGTPPEASGKNMRLGEGIVGWVAENGQPLLVEDVQHEPRYVNANPRTRSELAVPLKAGDKTIGLMNAESPYARRFTQDDLRLLTTLAGQMAVIIQNARLHAETQRRLAHVTTLYRFARELSTSLDLNTVLDSIVALLKQVLDCRAANIWLVNSETGQLEIRAAAGLQTRWKRQARLKLGEGVAGQVAATARPIYVPDTHATEFVFFDHAVRSLLCVPLIAHERVIGVLAIDSSAPNAFTSDDELLLTITAAQASVALENARLFEEVAARARKLEQAYSHLQEVDRLKDELVQNMSHELKTPLTFIKGYVELLLAGEMGTLNAAQAKSLRIVADKTDGITRLVNDIILLQQLDRGSLELEPLDLGPVAQRVVQDFAAQAAARQINLALQAPEALPPVLADQGRLIQVLNNLVGNAIKFSPNGGQITIRLHAQDTRVQTSVSDTGIGIPQHLLTKIFERFYQVDGSSTRHYGGTGLGLAIVKRIVEAHGGDVWAESQLGQGSSFYFTLPQARPSGWPE